MFHRVALVPIGILEESDIKKTAFQDDLGETISFPYEPDNFVYFRCRAITADAANGNGDYFPEDEIRKAYKTFVGVGLYKDHQSDSVDKSIGKVLWAEWVPSGKYVECYCAVDKHLAPDLAHRVKVGIATSVSMGCSVQEAQCSICKNVAHNVNELCAHMAPGFGQKGRKNHDGTIVYEINRGIQFNELSLVTVPADPTARIFEIYASLGKEEIKRTAVLEETSAELDLERLKKFYIEMHTPAIIGAVGLSEKEIVNGIVEVGAQKAEELKSKSRLRYEEFLQWIKDNPFLVSGQLGSVSAASNIVEATDKDISNYVKYLPFINYRDVQDPKRAEKVREFLGDITYREDTKRGGTSAEENFVNEYLEDCALLQDLISKDPEQLRELDEYLSSGAGGTDIEKAEPAVSALIKKVVRHFKIMSSRFKFSNKQIEDRIAIYNNVASIEESRHEKDGKFTPQTLEEAFKLYEAQRSLPDKDSLKKEAMEMFKTSIVQMDGEYRQVCSRLRPWLREELFKLQKALDTTKRPEQVSNIKRNIISIRKELEDMSPPKEIVEEFDSEMDKLVKAKEKISEEDKEGRRELERKIAEVRNKYAPYFTENLVRAYNHYSGKKLQGEDVTSLTDKDWIQLSTEANPFEQVISGYYHKQVAKKEEENEALRRLYTEVIPNFQKEIKTSGPRPDWSPEEKVHIKTEEGTHELSEAGATGMMAEISKSQESATKSESEYIGIPSPGSKWVLRSDQTVEVTVESANDKKVTISDSLKEKTEMTNSDFYATYRPIESADIYKSTYVKSGKEVSSDIARRIDTLIDGRDYTDLIRTVKQLDTKTGTGFSSSIDWDKVLGKAISEDDLVDVRNMYSQLGLQTKISPETKKAYDEIISYEKKEKVTKDGKTFMVGDWGEDKSKKVTKEGPQFKTKMDEEDEYKDVLTSLNSDGVIKVYNSLEDKMGLSISYDKGSSLTTSFFVGREGSLVYRVAASEVLPLPVQEAIMLNDANVATPDQIVSDLATKYSKLDDFKRWAKKRKKKNKKVLLSLVPDKALADKMKEPVKLEKCHESEDGRKKMPENKEEKLPKVAAQEDKTPAQEVTETVTTPETPAVVTETPKTETTNLEEVKAAFQSLLRIVENKISATATQVVKMEAKVDGVAKPQIAPEPKGAIKEVSKTENPKGHVATSALKAEAMDDKWTVNTKELDKQPKNDGTPEVSWDLKEMGSEEVKVSNSNKAAGKVKKYYSQLGAGAEGTPEVAMDLKSSENSEVKLLREALAKEQAEKTALLEKEKLQTVADKIYNIVATLREKNLIASGSEDVVIDNLTKKFANLESLESLSGFIGALTVRANEETKPEADVTNTEERVVPQVFEATEATEDAVQLLSDNWNKK